MTTPVKVRGSGRRFRVNADAIANAVRRLALQHPVVISVVEMGTFDGRYVGFRDGTHRISVRKRSSWRRASATLWHELAHARQAERLGGFDGFDARWDAER